VTFVGRATRVRVVSLTCARSWVLLTPIHFSSRCYPSSMCAHRAPSTIPRSDVLSDVVPSSSPSSRSPSDSEGVDIAPISSFSKRKASLSPKGSRHPQKFARTDTSHRLGMTVTGTKSTSLIKDGFESRPSAASVPSRKRKRVLLPRNRELVHSLLRSGSGDSKRSNGQFQSYTSNLSSEATEVRRPGNHSEVIEVLSDDDTPPPGNFLPFLC